MSYLRSGSTWCFYQACNWSSEYIYNIKKSGNELWYQINQILEITSLESGKISLKYQEISRKKFLSLVQEELYQLNFLDYTFKIEERDVKNTTKIYIDTKCIPRIFAGVIKIFNKKNNFEECDPCYDCEKVRGFDSDNELFCLEMGTHW